MPVDEGAFGVEDYISYVIRLFEEIGPRNAVHDLCHSLRPHLKRHHLQANVGHYGMFSGKRWETEIYPLVRNVILAME